MKSFEANPSITTIVLPESIISIANYALYGLASGANIIIKALIPPSLSYYSIASTYKIYVPSVSVSLYKSTWSTFAD